MLMSQLWRTTDDGRNVKIELFWNRIRKIARRPIWRRGLALRNLFAWNLPLPFSRAVAAILWAGSHHQCMNWNFIILLTQMWNYCSFYVFRHPAKYMQSNGCKSHKWESIQGEPQLISCFLPSETTDHTFTFSKCLHFYTLKIFTLSHIHRVHRVLFGNL